MTVGAAWQWCRRIRHASDVGIANQRQDWMVERRSAKLDLPAPGSFAINGQHQFQEFQLFLLQRRFVFFREVFSLRGELIDGGVPGDPFFVHPCKLREQLQVTPSRAGVKVTVA